MNSLKMILNNGTEVSLSEVNFPLHIVVVRDTRQDVLDIWDELTSEALERVEFQDNGETIFTFLHCGVTGEQIVVNADGTMTGHYYMEGEREVAGVSDYETAAKILLGEEE